MVKKTKKRKPYPKGMTAIEKAQLQERKLKELAEFMGKMEAKINKLIKKK